MEKTTREKLLEAAFEEVYQNGYHGTGLTQILKRAGVNKGSMYHIFKSKKEMMLAVVDEVLEPRLEEKYGRIKDEKKNFMEKTFAVLYERSGFDFVKGCPLNNLVQELSPVDIDFKIKLEQLYFKFENILEEIIQKAVETDGLKVEDTKAFAVFFLAAVEGAISTGKKSQSEEHYTLVIKELEKIIKNMYL